MGRGFRILRSVLEFAGEALERGSVREALRARFGGTEPAEEEIGQVDGALLTETAASLQHMLGEIDELERALPADAKAIGEAARSLVEASIEECRKPLVDAVKLSRDMQQVGALALAMRERLLLSPWSRKTPPN